MYNKPKPTIERIELTEVQKADIQRIVKGFPSEETIERQKARGVDVTRWLRNRRPESMANRLRRVKDKYNLGTCHICSQFADYNVTYQMDGVTLVEYWCEKHKDWIDKL